ncbi:DUF6332 family protein [Streptomyces sp. NPDC059909]|uniref:DUF6332 family protein n=1 Tax=Streptomyces sp. NPDC059909 TaxID=3346998 RepID=UPI0036585282
MGDSVGRRTARRTQAERDAITVEIGYALFSAVFATALVFGAIAGPALLLDLPFLVVAGGAVAGLAFVARVVHVLWRFPRAAGSAQPSQPGRTSPDS